MIYIVEDDSNIRQMESYALKNSGYVTQEFSEGKSFWAALETCIPQLIILDIMLPGEDGLSLLRSLRQDRRTQQVPVILVTARDTELDIVKGLDQGADDYIAKPFGIMEFISRVKAMLRRGGGQSNQVVYALGGLSMNDEKRQVTMNGQICNLTFKEYELLKYLLINQGIVLSREKIMDRVWGTDFEGESRTVDMHIKTLRQKLGAAGSQIKTIIGVGYRLESEA